MLAILTNDVNKIVSIALWFFTLIFVKWDMPKKVTPYPKPPKARHFIKDWRKHRGYTQEELAEILGITHSAISQLENGKTSYTQQMLESLADVLYCTAADLIARPPSADWGLDMMIKDSSEADRTTIIEMVKAFVKNRAA